VTERNKAGVARFFAGYDLVEPGVVVTRQWRPGIGLEFGHSSLGYGGAGQRI
jgi:hypothetical protein